MVRETVDPGADQVAAVRGFNRFVTARIGVLDDHYLARDRPLGQARLLWEIGRSGGDVRALRARLDLDSGYLSRLLHGLESDGLLVVDTGDDARTRTATLTSAGEAEYRELERLSDGAAHDLLAPLSPARRARLVEAMDTVQRLLTGARIVVAEADADDERVHRSAGAYYAELADRFDGGFDPGTGGAVGDDEVRPPRGLVLLATLDDETVGCGALTRRGGGVAEIKRLWTSPTVRGTGLGSRLLDELESRAADLGCDRVRLDTNASLHEAIALYRATGYREIEPYNDNPYAQLWFEKSLATVG